MHSVNVWTLLSESKMDLMLGRVVGNENWPKANLHVTKENKSFKKKVLGALIPIGVWC